MYSRTIKLEDNEIPAKINKETGEIIEEKQPRKYNRLKEGETMVLPEALFHKGFDFTNQFLMSKLNKTEWWILSVMISKAKPNTNSLEPLDDETSFRELELIFNTDRRILRAALKKLFDLGVYARFSVAEVNNPCQTYWILNPYISFKGRVTRTDIIRLFDNTIIALEYKKSTTGKKVASN